MANANQVIVNGETILDLRSDTVTPGTLQKGYTAHDKSGTKITGTLEASSVSVQPTKSVTYTANGTATITPDAGYDALSSVDVTVDVASGGGSGASTITFTVELGTEFTGTIIASDANGDRFAQITSDGVYTIPSKSIVIVTSGNSMVTGEGFSDMISGTSLGLYGAGFYLTGTNNVKFISLLM